MLSTVNLRGFPATPACALTKPDSLFVLHPWVSYTPEITRSQCRAYLTSKDCCFEGLDFLILFFSWTDSGTEWWTMWKWYVREARVMLLSLQAAFQPGLLVCTLAGTTWLLILGHSVSFLLSLSYKLFLSFNTGTAIPFFLSCSCSWHV